MFVVANDSSLRGSVSVANTTKQSKILRIAESNLKLSFSREVQRDKNLKKIRHCEICEAKRVQRSNPRFCDFRTRMTK
ncbi:hypothetical protein ACWIUD_06425 [Helicobacter sp. 23-1044]